MGMSVLKKVLSLALLSASSTASSFATTSSLVHMQKRTVTLDKVANLSRGGEDRRDDNSAELGTAVPSSPTELAASLYSTELGAVSSSSTELGAAPKDTGDAFKNMGPNAAPPGFLRKTFPSFPWYRVPNILTYMRCIAIPLLVLLFYQPDSNVATSSLFAFASFTDWLDGYLARRWDITSAFGAFLDPVADKLMVSTSLILLTGRYGRNVAIPTLIILAREIAVSALREWMAQRQLRDAVKVGMQGKIKTAATMFSLTFLLLVPSEDGTGFLSKLYNPSLVMLYLCALVTVTSGSVYFRAAAPVLMESK